LTKKNAVLVKLSSFNNSFSLYFLNTPTKLFKGSVGFFCVNLLSCLKKNILVSVGEVGEKVLFISNKPLTFLRVCLSSFNSRNTKLRGAFSYNNVFGKLILPQRLFIESSFDFISTLGYYKKSSWSISGQSFWLGLQKTSLYSFRCLLDLNKNPVIRRRLFIVYSNINFLKGSLKSFPLYLGSGYVYLTEIKSISKENLFQEDTFLKKSSKLLKFIGFLRSNGTRF
jgi:hypothetical protein